MRGRTRVSLALLAAGALHGGGVVWLAHLQLAPPPTSDRLQLSFELAPPPPRPVEEPPAREPPPAPPPKQREPAKQKEPVKTRAPEPKPTPERPPEPAPSPAEPSPEEPGETMSDGREERPTSEEQPAPQRQAESSPPPPASPPPGEYKRGLVRTPDGRLQHDAVRFKAEIQRDGSVRFEDKPDFELFSDDLPLGSARFDINDALWRLAGKDPYRYQKRRFLKETQALRDEKAMAHAEEMLGPALVELAATLEELLDDATLTAAEKRAAVFELWDDCNDERAGRAARAGIEAFVRAKMPRGSPLGYSEEELARLGEHLPRAARFSPYGHARNESGSGA